MKIEKISDTQIRCTLNSKDLSDRNLRLNELAYGSEKAKALFRDMVQQAFKECDMPADDIPLMIEAIPLSPDCLVLLITKIPEPDELDTRFSSFSAAFDDLDPDLDDDTLSEPEDKNYADEILSCFQHFSDVLGETLLTELMKHGGKLPDSAESLGESTDGCKEGCPDASCSNPSDGDDSCGSKYSDKAPAGAAGPDDSSIRDFVKRYVEENIVPPSSLEELFNEKDNSEADNQRFTSLGKLGKLYSFGSLNEVIAVAKTVRKIYHGENTLYKDPSNSRYYLVISLSDHTAVEFNKICNIISDYGKTERISSHGFVYYEEHCRVIIRNSALQKLAKL